MVDPDYPVGYAPIEREKYKFLNFQLKFIRRHWIVANIPGNNIDAGKVISIYEKPTLPRAAGIFSIDI